jgi:predicted nucleic acid-binding protein
LKTFLDSGVLLTAWKAKDQALAEAAIAIMEDDAREFCSADMVKLELLPKPAYFKQKAELDFYALHFDQVKELHPFDSELGSDAFDLASKHGLAAADALTLAAALRLGAVEFITAELPGKPMFRVPGIRVLSLHGLKQPSG